jgi:Domain of unknown function (DUF4287)
MTRQSSFKRLVRNRMEKTGESYTSARASLLAAVEPKATDPAVLTMSEEAILRRTGRGWEDWFDMLDEWGGVERKHAEIASWLSEEHGIGGWDAQSVTVSYERARGLREVGETSGGFAAGASKTVAVPVERLYDAFIDETLRERWLPDGQLSVRTATEAKSIRFDWGDGATRVNVWFEPKGEAKSTATLSHERLADGDEVERLKSYWRERVASLKEVLER